MSFHLEVSHPPPSSNPLLPSPGKPLVAKSLPSSAEEYHTGRSDGMLYFEIDLINILKQKGYD